ncbi:DUF998 domain-containing protein [Amycolatopsis sp. NPDC051372]|uniref:DUF998 domain-containing protein n=1 Tax=unclassified Amycolatopsis TaxID=2618356 RepID=UPI00341A2713
MTTTSPRPARISPIAWTAIGLWTAALALVGGLTIGFADRVDPFRDPVSDYALHRWGRALFTIAVLLVLAGGIALVVAAHLAGLPRDRAVSVLFGLWVAGLFLVLLFQENPSTTVVTVHGEIHRFGGAVLFACLPLACRALVRLLRADPRWSRHAQRVRSCGRLAFATAAAFGIAQFVSELPQGLLERGALAGELGTLVTIALVVRTAAR